MGKLLRKQEARMEDSSHFPKVRREPVSNTHHLVSIPHQSTMRMATNLCVCFCHFFPFQFYWDTIDICCCSVPKSCPILMTPWTVVHQAPPFVGFSRQEYWNGLPFPSPGDLPNPGINLWLSRPLLGRRILYYFPLGKPSVWHSD